MISADLATSRSIGHERLESLLAGVIERVGARGDVPGEGRRRYERLELADELGGQVEAWLIAWPAGSGLGMHDHQGSDAVLVVLRSSLRERYLDAGGVRQRTLEPGVPVRLPSEHVHEVVNTTDTEAVSIHLYSPPLQNLDFRTDRALEFVLVAQER